MTISRRDFVKSTAASVGALAWSGSTFAAESKGDEIRVAVIGFNGMGNKHINQLKHRVVALCDVDAQLLSRKASEVQQKWGQTIDTYTDFRKLLERDDIDAVSIATPNHTHALIGISAAQAGKHVYVEKPVCHNIWEGRQLAAAARRYDVRIQCGTQSRSSPSLHKAVKFVQGGELGKIEYAIGTCYKARKSIGKLDKPLRVPPHVDYELWCGPAEKRELFRPSLHYDWHWDFNTGNGDMGNQGIHQMDIARWFLGEDQLAPRVLSIGGRLGYDDAGDTPNTQITYLDYPTAPLIFETRGLPRDKEGQKKWGESMDRYRGSDIGVIVQCERGHVLVPSYTKATAFDLAGKEIKTWQGGKSHHQNWLAAIRAGDSSKLNAEVQEGHLSSSLCHMGAISHQLGARVPVGAIAERLQNQPLLLDSFERMAKHLRANEVDIDGTQDTLTLGPWLKLDPVSEEFTDNAAASELRTRQYREPFAVPDIEREA